MTLPCERRWAVNNTRQFLLDLLDPKKTPRVPSAVRKEASRCLRHYPGSYYMERSKELAPEVWGDWKGENHSNVKLEKLDSIVSECEQAHYSRKENNE